MGAVIGAPFENIWYIVSDSPTATGTLQLDETASASNTCKNSSVSANKSTCYTNKSMTKQQPDPETQSSMRVSSENSAAEERVSSKKHVRSVNHSSKKKGLSDRSRKTSSQCVQESHKDSHASTPNPDVDQQAVNADCSKTISRTTKHTLKEITSNQEIDARCESTVQKRIYAKKHARKPDIQTQSHDKTKISQRSNHKEVRQTQQPALTSKSSIIVKNPMQACESQRPSPRLPSKNPSPKSDDSHCTSTEVPRQVKVKRSTKSENQSSSNKENDPKMAAAVVLQCKPMKVEARGQKLSESYVTKHANGTATDFGQDTSNKQFKKYTSSDTASQEQRINERGEFD